VPANKQDEKGIRTKEDAAPRASIEWENKRGFVVKTINNP
jgi:hypothetical protein